MSKKILLIMTILLLSLSITGCPSNEQINVDKDYELIAYGTGLQINLSSAESLLLCNTVSDFWSEAINNGQDFNDAVKKVTQVAKETDFLQKLNDDKKSIDNMMNQLNKPTDENKDLYNKLLSLYGQYTKLYELATIPKGSLVSYNKSVNEIYSEIQRLYNEFVVLVPRDVIEKVENNMK